MIKKSVFVKTCTVLFATSLVAGAFTYSTGRMSPQEINFSAFKNASQNIQFIAEKNEIQKAVAANDVTAGIVKVIENEVRGKIKRTRYSMVPRKVKPVVVAAVVEEIQIVPEVATVEMDLNLDRYEVENVSEFEINNGELVKLYGYNVENLRFDTFANTQIASVETPAELKNDLNTDEVKVAQASTTTNVVEEIIPEASAKNKEADKEAIEQAKIATTENPINDDLVVFDYSTNNKTKASAVVKEKDPGKMFDAPISASVKNAILREVNKTPNAAVSTQLAQPSKKIASNALEAAMNDEDAVVYDYSKQTASALTKSEETKKAIAAFTATSTPEEDLTTQAEFTIKAKEINLNTQKVRQSFGFEFVPDYDRAERTDDQTSGEIKLGYALSGDVNTQTGVVQAQGMISTRIELNLLNNGINVPLFNEESIQKFLQKKNLDITGNLLMVAVDPSINDVEIDSDYQAKLFFTEKFKLLESQENAAYVLFLGVKTGNVLTRYLLSNKESAQKIVYVGDGEMYFEDPNFKESQRELYTFTTRSLLGRKVKELNIDGADVTFFGTKTFAKKKTLNSYELKVPEMVENSRKYLEFKHMGQSLFVGTQGATEIEIPGQDFIGRVLQANQLSELGERCMVQINLVKDLRDIKVSGKNRTGEMFAETSFLDNDGNFSRDNSELAEKVFVTGDLEGIFNVRLDYTDGSTDFLKTFCSEGSYLIEQL
jgi:hypothetical protein